MEEIALLQAKLKENPNDLQTIEQYAIALADIGENEEALKNFVYLKKNNPNNPTVYYNIGIILELIQMKLLMFIMVILIRSLNLL